MQNYAKDIEYNTIKDQDQFLSLFRKYGMKHHTSFGYLQSFFRGIEKKIDTYSHDQLMHLVQSLYLIGLPQEDVLHSVMPKIDQR